MQPVKGQVDRNGNCHYLLGMFWKILLPRVWQLGIVLTVLLGLLFYFVLGRSTKKTTTELVQKEQLTLTRAEASNLVSFFQVFGDSLAVLAQSNGLEQKDTTTVNNMDAFVEQWRDSGIVGGIILTNSKGVVEFNSNVLEHPDVGASIADLGYFAWAKKQKGEGEYFVGKPVVGRLGASKGQVIIPVASPVFKNGSFVGVLAAAVRLEPLASRYLELMKVSDMTHVYLLDENSDVLYRNSLSVMVGSNISEHLGESAKDMLKADSEGQIQTKEHLIVNVPVLLDDHHWMLVTASDVHGLHETNEPIYMKQGAILLFAYLTVLSFGIISTQEISNIRRKKVK